MKVDKQLDEKVNKAINTAGPKKHFFEIIIWELFNRNRRDAFLKAIDDGMSWEFAYRKAKES